ncbi:MAG TPA: hypothetical protein VM370_00170 [Candidatus Thermoplasmatota archaeon]|nr:hypothetical protein [Candidatus Thermoplasmatota archaeon]
MALALAGCLAAPAAPASDGVAPRTWRIDGCAFVIAVVPVDEAALAARLPEGFALAPSRLPALPGIPRGAVELDAYQCAGGAWFGRNATPLAYGSHYAAVAAPDALQQEGYDATFVKWDTLVADDAARASLALAGAPVHDGDALVTIDGARLTASLSFDDGTGFSLTGALQPPAAQGAPLPFMEFTPLAGGSALARWHARLHDARIGSGAGVVQLPEGSWVREMVGAPSAPVQLIAGTWNLDEADVAFPVAWPVS